MADPTSILQIAKQLIEEKHYDEARALLKKIDHPTATRWLAKLDEIAPAPKSKSQKSNKGIFITIGLVAVFIVLLGVFVLILSSRNTESPAADTTNVVVSAPTLPAQSTSIPVTLQNTSVPSTNNPGLRTNPIPLGTGYSFPGLGTLAVAESQWTPNQTGLAIVRLSFTCERPANQICNVNRLLLQAVGSSGLVYARRISSTIPDPNLGVGNAEVFGGATLEGNVGFDIFNPENGLTMKVYGLDIEGDAFFNLTSNPLSFSPVITPEGVEGVVASDSDFGSRENPLPIGTGYQLPGYGILTVTEVQWESGSTGIAIVKLALSCQLSPDQSCDTSDFLIDGVGVSGALYERSFDFSNIPNPRWGEEIYGGGSIEGYTALLITVPETALSLRIRGSPVRTNLDVDELFYQMIGSGSSTTTMSSLPSEPAPTSETSSLAARVGELMEADAEVMSDPALVQVLGQAKADYSATCVDYFNEQQGDGEFRLDFSDICTALTDEQFMEWGAIPAFVDCQQQFSLLVQFDEYRSCVQRNGVRILLDIE